MKNQYSWQDFVSLYLGAWTFLTPWIVGHPAGAAVIASYVIAGCMISFFAITGLVVFQPWPECINIVLGIWLLVSPWLLRFASVGSLRWSALVIGALVIICSGFAVSEKRARQA
jgi:predicted signal transduction protein with EAL and GGDEF domain